MFVQVITGKVTDTDGFQQAGDRWETELRPGATGFLGSTSGVTADGRFVAVAQFDSEANARKNSERPEQGEWWAAMEKTVSDVTFKDSTEVTEHRQKNSDHAGFVQVMLGRVKDAAKLAAIEKTMAENMEAMKELRPDVIGDLSARHADGTYTDVIYFTSEAEARDGESKPPPPEFQQMMADMHDAIVVDEYLDLSEPRLR